MPVEYRGNIGVTWDELVPAWWPSYAALRKCLYRDSKHEYGLKRLARPCINQPLLIDFDSLPREIQADLGDPRKLNHVLEKYYEVDARAVRYYADYTFSDNSYIDDKHQDKYVVNASVLRAVLALREAREFERSTKGTRGRKTKPTMTTLCEDAHSFNKTLAVKYGVEHTLPRNERRFADYLKAITDDNYEKLISGKHKNTNRLKVDANVLRLLKAMFAKDPAKPTATEIHRRYSAFLSGYIDIIDKRTGEEFNPADFPTLSDRTVTEYLIQVWENKIVSYSLRSGDRLKYMQMFKTPHSLQPPDFAGSLISIDDRQPPFKTKSGKRIWFYNAIDLASECFTCWVYGQDKKDLIQPFYRQLVRNYTEWNLPLPDGLECESSLNASFKNTFLKKGAMFQNVRIEANNARGKRIEGYYRQLRYELEKEFIGWLARPFALSEANQTAIDFEKVAQLDYEEIVEIALSAIQKWNNMPHSVYPELTRWQYFLEKQNPGVLATNWRGFMKDLGYMTKTSCRAGQIRLQNSDFLLGDNGKIATGDLLLDIMRQVEGEAIDVYWLDDNEGNVLKALVYIGTKYVCEAIAKPAYQRAVIEQTPADLEARSLMSRYVQTVEEFVRRERQEITEVMLIDNREPLPQEFKIGGYKDKVKRDLPPLPPLPAPAEAVEVNNKPLKYRF